VAGVKEMLVRISPIPGKESDDEDRKDSPQHRTFRERKIMNHL
jgi:hypothetical protein